MKYSVYVFDPTAVDQQSRVRGIGRYLQLLKESFPNWIFTSKIENWKLKTENYCFINPFFNFLQPPLIMRRLVKKQIVIIHDLIPLKYPGHFPTGLKGRLNIMLNRLALKNYDLIVTDSEASKKDIVRMLKIKENNVKVIYPCQSKKLLVPRSSKSEVGKIEKYCLYVGDATWNKNLVNLAKAIKIADIPCIFIGKVFDRVKNYQLRITDSKNIWLKEFEEFSKITKGDKRFIFKGFVSDYELVKLYQQAKVNILVSRDEGFGFSYVEAAQFGCPSILSNTPILKEISDRQGALFADPNNPDDIAEKIKEVFKNNSLRQKLSSEALQQSFKYSKKEFVDSWNTILMTPIDRYHLTK